MPPVIESWSTATVGLQALQLANTLPVEPVNRVGAHDSDGRKRKRITPFVTAPAPSSRPLKLSNTRLSGFHGESLAEPETWDHLAKWEMADASIVEDIDEGGYYSDVSDISPSIVDETGHESDEEIDFPPELPTGQPGQLSTAQITEIINDCIEGYATAWKPGKGETKREHDEGESEAPVVYDNIALWEEAHAAGQQEEFLEKYRLEAEYYQQRLHLLCEEISKDPGDTVASVKMKCRNLEVTVELLERANWFVSIYELSPVADSDDDEEQEEEEENEVPLASNRAGLSAVQSCSYSQQHSPSQVIDLGTPSDSSGSEDDHGQKTQAFSSASISTVVDTIEDPDPASAEISPTTAHPQVPLGDAPEHASISTVRRWSWSQLQDTQDRKRVVSKAIHEMSPTDRETLRQRLQKVGRAAMAREIPGCIYMFLRGDQNMPGILPQDLAKIVTFTRLFLCWWLCGNYFEEIPLKSRLEELVDCLQQQSPDPGTFCDYVDTVLSTTFSPTALKDPMQPSQAEIIEISDDDE
ncbi:hypothetical protein EJ07DRAFT_108179 [Lizonia empirigonia]|nr:hypothetical protein EJ07DRAFT_108179 [Lizonia empirigonia]